MTASGLAFEFYVFSDIIERLGRNRRRKKISVSDAVRAGQKGPICPALIGPFNPGLTRPLRRGRGNVNGKAGVCPRMIPLNITVLKQRSVLIRSMWFPGVRKSWIPSGSSSGMKQERELLRRTKGKQSAEEDAQRVALRKRLLLRRKPKS